VRLFWPRWLFRVRCEREAIAETRPSAAILAAMAGARRSEQPALREALANGKTAGCPRPRIGGIREAIARKSRRLRRPISAAVLSEIGGTAISKVELRRSRLALLLPYRGDPPPSVSEQQPPGEIALTAGASARR